jgi:hypothetical protein
MSGVNGIIRNLDKRVGALESDGLEESAILTQITKLYADIEISVVLTANLHQYPVCGTGTLCSESLII